METTRHFTATMYIVCDGKTALHKHEGLEMWLPPGGHIDRDELPHEAAVREAKEETGLEVSLMQKATGPASTTAVPLPEPETLLLEDITHVGDAVSHQHIDFIYFGTSQTQDISPHGHDEVAADEWEWISAEQLRKEERFVSDVATLGIAAITATQTAT